MISPSAKTIRNAARTTTAAAQQIISKHRRCIMALTAAAGLGTLLAACNPQEAPRAKAAAAEPIVLTALVWAPDWADDMHRVADAFTREHPGIRINLQFMIGNSVEENLKPKAATNSLPDIFSVNPNPYTSALADQGLLADIGDTLAWSQMLELLQTEWTSPGHRRYGIPTGLATTLIYYNRDMFSRAGIDTPPADFEQFVAAGLALKKAGFTPLALSGGFPNMLGNGPFSYGFANNIAAQTPDWRARLADGTLAVDSPAGADIFAKIKLLADKKLLQPNYMRAGYDDTLRLFSEGRAAMTFQGTWAAGMLMHARNQRVGVFAAPWNDPGRKLVPAIGSETGFAVAQNASDANRRAAKQFIDFLYGPGMVIWQTHRQNIPPFKKLGEEVAGDRALFALVEQLAADAHGPGLYYSYLPANTIDRLHVLLQAVLFGQKSPAQAASLLHESIREQARSENR